MLLISVWLVNHIPKIISPIMIHHIYLYENCNKSYNTLNISHAK